MFNIKMFNIKIQTDRTLGQVVKAKLHIENHTDKQTRTLSPKEKMEKKNIYIYIKYIYIYINAPKVHWLNFGKICCLFRYSTDVGYIKLIVEI